MGTNGIGYMVLNGINLMGRSESKVSRSGHNHHVHYMQQCCTPQSHLPAMERSVPAVAKKERRHNNCYIVHLLDKAFLKKYDQFFQT